MKSYDVIVTGAGLSGCTAALAAAACGARVLLLEQSSGPGGVAVDGGCPAVMGMSEGGRQIVGGVADELIRRLDRRGRARLADARTGQLLAGAIGERPLVGTVMSSSFDIRLELGWMLEERKVELLAFSRVVGCRKRNDRITEVAVSHCGRTDRYRGGVFIDATGSGELAVLAGAPFLIPDGAAAMTKTVMFTIGNVARFNKAAIRAEFERLSAERKVPYPVQDRFMGLEMLDEGFFLGNFTLTAGDPFDPRELTRMDCELRRQIPVWIDFLRRNLAPFRNCHLTSVAATIGVRDARNVIGRDLIRCRDLDDNTPVAEPAALALRGYGGHGIKGFLNPGTPVNSGVRPVPMGALQVRDFRNFLTAGKVISIEPAALTSVRLMGVAMATGQAAGVIAVHGAGEARYEEIKPILIGQQMILN